ncbi:hypothetical protein RRG08_029541 [Elysia crispata]|uniref:Uncharacterized protein n=1 Tax=Elysia crispata TaxID=231223 RepID=A0AAE0XWS9_9GAST|nr:hypothetical protein RRG08_029541 [Elysia crispata]
MKVLVQPANFGEKKETFPSFPLGAVHYCPGSKPIQHSQHTGNLHWFTSFTVLVTGVLCAPLSSRLIPQQGPSSPTAAAAALSHKVRRLLGTPTWSKERHSTAAFG